MIAGVADRNVQARAEARDINTALDLLMLLISKLIVKCFFTDTVCGESTVVQQPFKSPFVCIVEVL